MDEARDLAKHSINLFRQLGNRISDKKLLYSYGNLGDLEVKVSVCHIFRFSSSFMFSLCGWLDADVGGHMKGLALSDILAAASRLAPFVFKLGNVFVFSRVYIRLSRNNMAF